MLLCQSHKDKYFEIYVFCYAILFHFFLNK